MVAGEEGVEKDEDGGGGSVGEGERITILQRWENSEERRGVAENF